MFGGRILHALPRSRDQDLGRLVLVPDPLLRHPLHLAQPTANAAGRVEHLDDARSCWRSLSAVGFFGSIVLHELGHAFAAVRNGIGITGIQLWIFGGMARMDREADSPGTELKVALAGPLVTLAIFVVLTVGGIAAVGAHGVPGRGGARNRLRRLRARGAGRLAGDDQRPGPGLQPAAGLPDGRRPGRPRDRLVEDRRPHLGDPLRRQPRPRLRLPLHRRRLLPDPHRRPLRRHLAGPDRDGDQRLRPRRRDADRDHQQDRQDPRRRRDGPRTGRDPRRHQRRAGARRVLPALPLALVPGRRRRPPLPRPDRTRPRRRGAGGLPRQLQRLRPGRPRPGPLRPRRHPARLAARATRTCAGSAP